MENDAKSSAYPSSSNGQYSFAASFAGAEHQPFSLDAGADAPSALLVHGFPGTPAEMRPLAEALHTVGWNARGILLPGFGIEIDSIAGKRMEDWTLAVRAALTEMNSIRPTLLIGHSMGAALALATAAELPPDALILLSPFWTLDHALWKTLPVIRRVLPTVRPFQLIKIDVNDPETRKGMAQMMPGADLDSPEVQEGIKRFGVPTSLFDEIRRAGDAAARAAARVKIPTLILQGSGDTLVKPEKTRELASRIDGAVTYREVNGEHNLPDTSKPAWDAVRTAVVDFGDTIRQIGK